MAIGEVRELAVRSASVTLPDKPRYERKFVVSADPGTAAVEVVNAVGVANWAPHPEYSYALAKTFAVAPYQGSRRHWELTIGYEVPQQEDQDQSPLSRADVWSFSTGGAQIPALSKYSGSSRGPLTNSAGDFFEGLTTLEAEVRASISGNRAAFPLSMAVGYTNTVNSGGYLGGAAHTWLCAGIGGQQAVEVVNDTEIRYWQISVELVFRQSGHDLLLPDVGYNFISAGERLPCWVWALDESGNKTSKKVRASSVQKLTPAGGIDHSAGPPGVLTAQIYRETDFSVFGYPTF